MTPHHDLPPVNPKLQELRFRYNQLCARFAEISDADPLAASDTIQELQSLSDRIVAMEMRDEKLARERQFPEAAELRQEPHHLGRAANGNDGAPGPALSALDGPWGRSIRIAGRPVTDRSPGGAAPKKVAEEPPVERPVDFDRLYRAIKRQEVQIAAVLRRCEEHHQQLESLERRFAEQYPAERLAAQIEALNASLDHQRQRVTSLAIAIQRLLHWLAAERQRGRR